MGGADAWYRWASATELSLRIRVQPRASRDEIVGAQGDALKVRLTAPPVDGKANAQLLRFLADTFDVPPSRVALEQGAGARVKRITIRAPRRLPEGIEPPPAG